jgi:hypothetical protein
MRSDRPPVLADRGAEKTSAGKSCPAGVGQTRFEINPSMKLSDSVSLQQGHTCKGHTGHEEWYGLTKFN